MSMKSFIPAVSLLLTGANLVFASPTPTLVERADLCGAWDSVATGSYTIHQNLWGESDATSGSQCSALDSLKGNTLAWHTEWSWDGSPYKVKSFANVMVNMTSKALSSYKSLDTVWDYSYSGTGLIADVAYDTFLGTTPSASPAYEVMVWLARMGAVNPLTTTGSPIATPTIAGHTWNLYSGTNGDMGVFSFIASSEVTSFTGDLMDFFDYLAKNDKVSTSLYLQSIQAGSETFIGSKAAFDTTAFSVAIDGKPGISTATASTSTSAATSTSTSISTSASNSTSNSTILSSETNLSVKSICLLFSSLCFNMEISLASGKPVPSITIS